LAPIGLKNYNNPVVIVRKKFIKWFNSEKKGGNRGLQLW